MAWILLILGGLFEVGFTFCLGRAKELAEYPTRYIWYSGFVVCLFFSMYLLMRAVKTLPIGTAYAVWTGIGAVGTVLVGIFFFREPVTLMRVVFLSTLILSIIGLKVFAH